LNQDQSRKEAYRFILEILHRFPSSSIGSDLFTDISLDELMQLKEGSANPTPELVDWLKHSFSGFVNEAELDAHLIEPFKA
jgi:hypothetical protein